jgi:outer membrane biosynthesis protein TonB
MRSIILAAFFTLSAVVVGHSHEAEPPCDLASYGSALVYIDHPPLKAIKKVPPKYPEIAKAGHISGDAFVQAVVDRKGNVVHACAAGSHPLLRGAAEEAARGWKFKWHPDFFRLNRRLKYLVVPITLRFRLE